MQAFARGLGERGVRVVRFEFPYMAKRRSEGKKAPPDRMPVLEATFQQVVARLPAQGRRFVGGKSMGSRVAAHVADSLAVAGVVALGYPFHPPRRIEQLRLEPLRRLRAPCLIVQGTRDPLGSQAEVAGYDLPPHVRVRWLEDGDHSFEPRKASGRTLAQNLDEAIRAVISFVSSESLNQN